MCTVHPVTRTPCLSASVTACHPGNDGRSDGCVFSTRPSYASKKGAPNMVPNPAIATTSIFAALKAATTSVEYWSRSNSLPKLLRSTSMTGMPSASAKSIALQRLSTKTAATSTSALMMALHIEPVPDASTARRTPWNLVGVCYKEATISAMSSPASVGFRPTLTPASRKASIFASAVPLPPETMAPACPIFFPGGAVTPAM